MPGIQAAITAESGDQDGILIEDEEESPQTDTSAQETDDEDDFICPGVGLIRSPTNCSVYYNCPTTGADGRVSPRTAQVSCTNLWFLRSSKSCVPTDSTLTLPSPPATGQNSCQIPTKTSVPYRPPRLAQTGTCPSLKWLTNLLWIFQTFSHPNQTFIMYYLTCIVERRDIFLVLLLCQVCESVHGF